jgi:hypothetical protein
MSRFPAIALICCLVACGDDTAAVDAGGDDASTVDAASSFDARPLCDRTPAAANRTRYIAVNLPFATMDGDGYELLELDMNGTITRPGTSFDLGRSFLGQIAFTPDGEVGLVAQDDGTVGVFHIDSAGDVTVVHAAYDSGGDDQFYADSVVVHPDGQRAFILNSQWRKYGGGIWEAYINCDGSLDDARQVAAARLPYALAFTDDSTAVVAAKDMLDTVADDTAYLLDLDAPSVVASADAFGHTDAIVSDIALSVSGAYAIISDSSIISQNSVARVAVGDSTLTPSGTLTIFDPVAVVASPFDSTAMVITGEGDGVHYVDMTTFTALTEITYVGASPQLPGAAVMISRGDLQGRVLIAVNQGVHQVDFVDSAPPTDVGLTSFGSIIGAIGVQP